MRKMITKMMGILMAAVMIFGLMPGLTQVAHAAETIKNVAVTGFVKPETSATAITIDALSVPADAPYSIKRISWESSDIVPAEGGFQFDDISGERVYRLIIKLEADSGYSFASISQFESYTLNGGTEFLDKCEIDSDGYFRMYTKWYTPVAPETTTLSSVSLTVTEPTAGAPVPSYIVDVNNASVSAESGAKYTVVESGWLQNDGAGGSEYTTDTEFQAGKTYLLFATLSPNEGYQFSEECTGKVNGLDPEDYYRRDPDLIVYKEFTVPGTPATYMITVTNGKAYSDEACTTEITSASEGTRIYFKTDTPPAGKFAITGVFPSTVEISYIYDVPSFLMPGEDVTINTLFANQIPYTVDLTTNTADGSKVVSEMRMACEQGVVSSPDHTASVYKIDLDNNGDLDISFNQAYTKEMTVLESTNLHGDYIITVAEAMYSPITFKFPDTTPVTEYPVWVGDTQVTSANKDDILGDGGKAKYDPDTNTLTLNDPTVTGSYEGAKIYAKAMTLTVTGKVTLSGADFGIDVRGYSGYLGRLIITGNGTNIDAAGNTSGISAKDGVIINGGTIRASGSVAGISSATVSISGDANVTATASAEPESYGIYASSGIGIFDATVTATAGDGIGATGIYSKAGDITISGGTVTVTAGAGGIYAYDGEVKIENGTAKVEATVGTVAVRGKNGITIGDELMIKLPEGGTVESNSGSYDIMDGSSVARHALIVPKEATTYTVTFDVNGHGTAPAAQTVEDGKTATKPADPTETGWTFGGWYKEAACTNAFDFSTPITADITLYAKWTEESVTPGVITYTVVSGGDSTWTKDSTSTITITVKRSEADDTCFSHFSSVQIDGTTLATGDYEAKAGSTVITLKAATLQKLSTGSHTITVIFDDGKAETSVTVKAAASPADSKSPKTGDSNHMGLWIILMIISVIWLGTAVLIRKKNRYTSKH